MWLWDELVELLSLFLAWTIWRIFLWLIKMEKTKEKRFQVMVKYRNKAFKFLKEKRIQWIYPIQLHWKYKLIPQKYNTKTKRWAPFSNFKDYFCSWKKLWVRGDTLLLNLQIAQIFLEIDEGNFMAVILKRRKKIIRGALSFLTHFRTITGTPPWTLVWLLYLGDECLSPGKSRFLKLVRHSFLEQNEALHLAANPLSLWLHILRP